MFLNYQAAPSLRLYKNMLESVGALSRLSSTSSVPYLGYREAENIFCMAFEAENLSRLDCSADAKKDSTGIGIKTFLNGNGKTLQKVAEFNSDAQSFRGKTPKEIVERVAYLRNERINLTKRLYAMEEMIYHCIVREVKRIKVFETPMDLIDIRNIKNIDASAKNTITFEDGITEYSFNISKSTLYKRFITQNILLDIDINILDNPFEVITKLVVGDLGIGLKFAKIEEEKPHLFLPLFSDRGGRNVPERSGLNQWNAKGRPRDFNEIYIPIPAWIHSKYPGFFPPRDNTFDLILPDRQVLSAKVCQAGDKALMSNPNLALGKWLLRTVMNLKEGELLTYDRLEELGVDSVVVYKEDQGKYSIDFTQIGSFDQFVKENS